MDIYTSLLSPAADIGAGCYLLLVAVLSILGNLLVLIMAVKRSTKMKPPELLSVNLAVTDLGAAVTMYPMAVASAWSHRWLGGNVTCVYYGLIGFFFGITSIMTLTCLAVVRFIVCLDLHSPTDHKINRKNVKLLCMFTWLYALVWALCPILGWGRYGPELYGLSCSLAWTQMKQENFSFVICMFLLILLIPCLIIICCYFGIAIKLYFTYKKTNTNNHVPNIVKLHRRMFVIAVFMSMGFIASWVPYAIVSLWSILKDSSTIPPEISLLPCMFAKTSTVYNPLIYFFCSKSFKTEVKQLCLYLGSNRCQVANTVNGTDIYVVRVDDKNDIEMLSIAGERR